MEGEKKGQEEGDFTDVYDEMPGWTCWTACLGGMRLQSVLTLFTCATPSTPAGQM